MRRRHGIALALGIALLVPVETVAQSYPQVLPPAPPPADLAVDARMVALPTTVGGLPRTRSIDLSPSSRGFAYESSAQPSLSIRIGVQRTVPFDWAERRDNMRSLYKGPFFQIIREGTFTVPGKPNAKTIFAEYNTDMGIRQIWRMKDDDLETVVFVYIGADGYRDRMVNVIASEIFGGAVIADGPPAPLPAT